MSSFETSTLMNEVNAIVNNEVDNDAWYYEGRVLVGSAYYNAYKVISIDVLRDYGTAYADKVVVELSLPGGTFLHDILPYKEDLKVQLIKHPQSTMFGQTKTAKKIVTRTFRATLIQTESPETAGSSQVAKAGKDALNLMDIRRVEFQLQDVVLEQLRLVTMGTIVRQATPSEIVKGMITQGSKSINVDQENAVKGVTMIEADNLELQTHTVIPHGTKMIDIPDLVQNEYCGIYNGGLGFYLQNAMWYIWPLYNFDRFDTTAKTVTIILAPSNKLQGVERTYRVTANQLIIVVTGGAVHFDDTEAQLLNEGNGIRFSDSRRLIEGFGKVKGNKVVASRGENNTEFAGIHRASGLNHLAKLPASNNIYRETSRLAARKGSKMIVNWQNSDPDLLTPAMACQVIFERKGLPVTLKATIVGSHTYISSADGGVTTRRHLTNTALSLFVDKDLPELKDYVAAGNVDQYSRPL